MSAPPQHQPQPQQNQQNLLVTLVNTQSETIEAFKKLLPYMENRIAELTTAVQVSQKDVATYKRESQSLRSARDQIQHRLSEVNTELETLKTKANTANTANATNAVNTVNTVSAVSATNAATATNTVNTNTATATNTVNTNTATATNTVNTVNTVNADDAKDNILSNSPYLDCKIPLE